MYGSMSNTEGEKKELTPIPIWVLPLYCPWSTVPGVLSLEYSEGGIWLKKIWAPAVHTFNYRLEITEFILKEKLLWFWLNNITKGMILI